MLSTEYNRQKVTNFYNSWLKIPQTVKENFIIPSKDIEVLERGQKAATHFVPKLRKYTYSVSLQKLGITSLKDRRERGDMIEVYKLLTGREQIESKQFIPTSTESPWFKRARDEAHQGKTETRHEEIFL